MDTKEFTIADIKDILSCSHPTAHNFATKHGEMRDVGYGTGKWFVPAEAVEKHVAEILQDALEMQARLDTALSNGANS